MRALVPFIAVCAALGCGGEDAATGGLGGGGGGTGGAGTGGVSDGGGGAGVGGAGGGGAGGGGAAPFALEVSTEVEDDVLHLRTNLPHDLAACQALVDAPCDDLDADGLPDAWEDVVLDRMRPFVRFDEAEQLVDDPMFVTAIVARVTPSANGVLVYIMLGYAEDFGSCGGFTAHPGDSERVALDLELLDAGDARVRQAYTAAHEGTPTDSSMVFNGPALSELEHSFDANQGGEPRWLVYASADKHATYATAAICEGISPIPCVDEDCHPDGVADAGPYTRLFPFINAGEPDVPLVTELSIVGFPGDEAWLDQDFCGGLSGPGCASPVVEKLTINPF